MFVAQSVIVTVVVTAASPLAGATVIVPFALQLPSTAVIVCGPGAAVNMLDACGVPPSIAKVIPAPDGVFTVIVAVFVVQSVVAIVVVTAANAGGWATVTVPDEEQLPFMAVMVCEPGAAVNMLDACGVPPSIAKVIPAPDGVFTVIVAVLVVQSVVEIVVVTAANAGGWATVTVPDEEQLPFTAVRV